MYKNVESALKSIESTLVSHKKQDFLFKNIDINLNMNLDEYFPMTNIIRTTNVREVRNMKPKIWTQISGPGLRLLILSSILDSR